MDIAGALPGYPLAVTVRDTVEEHLDRIERLNPSLNAIITLDAEGARRRADELDAFDAPVGPLHGLPITIKDAWATAGLRTTSGMVERADHVPDRDALVVNRLRNAGAVILGKTNVPAEITGQETANALFGRTVNPHDPARTPGGSSGGAAAAVAAGLSVLDVGSDSGGSIRQPAHCCGVFGHLATSGTIPLAGHLPTLEPHEVGVDIDMMGAGPIAADPSLLAPALAVLAGRALPPAKPVRRAALWVEQPVSDEVRKALEALPGLEEARPFAIDEAVEVAFKAWVAAPDPRRPDLERRWAELFDTYDVVVCPISPVVAIEHDPEPEKVHDVERRLTLTIDVDGVARPYLDQITWNIVVALAGLPATAVPVGASPGGLPIGAQVVGPRFADHTTIAFAQALSRALA